jgi:hypothetical protein
MLSSCQKLEEMRGMGPSPVIVLDQWYMYHVLKWVNHNYMMHDDIFIIY